VKSDEGRSFGFVPFYLAHLSIKMRAIQQKMSKIVSNKNYQTLKKEIGELLAKGREQAGRAVNTILSQTYWQIGRHIVEFEQGRSGGCQKDCVNEFIPFIGTRPSKIIAN